MKYSGSYLMRAAKMRKRILKKLNLKKLKPLPKWNKHIPIDDECLSNPSKFGTGIDIFFRHYLYSVNREMILSQYKRTNNATAEVMLDFHHKKNLNLKVQDGSIKALPFSFLFRLLKAMNFDIGKLRVYSDKGANQKEINYEYKRLKMHLWYMRNKGKFKIYKEPKKNSFNATYNDLIDLEKRYKAEEFCFCKRDMLHLKKLIKLIPLELFKVKYRCLASPVNNDLGFIFDLLIDDTLIEIKTVNDYKITDYYVCQLFVYAVIYNIMGTPTEKKHYPIKNIAIYFARQGVMWKQSIDSLISKNDFANFTEWFKKEYMYKVDGKPCKS